MTRLTSLPDSHANRGRAFEDLVIQTNEQYRARGLAVVQKIATPTKVIRQGKQIVSAFHSEKSTVDFIGTYQGLALAFDVKSTRQKTRFPLRNVESHQVEFLNDWRARGGVSFLLVEFAALGRVFLVQISVLNSWICAGLASAPLDLMAAECPEVKFGARGYYLDWLGALDSILVFREE